MTFDESEYAETTSFKFADRKLEDLIERLRRQNVCGCCTARALIVRGAELMEDTAGTEETIETLEELLGALRTGPAVPPSPSMPSTEAH
jgi:hypothetical protein